MILSLVIYLTQMICIIRKRCDINKISAKLNSDIKLDK